MHLNDNFSSEAELKAKLDFIYEKSKLNKSFNGLLEIAFNEVTIITAIHNVKSNKGANTAGIDKKKIEDYLQMDRNELINLVRDSAYNYRPKPSKRIYIPKSNGDKRPLGISTALDRIIQECIRTVIEPIVEAKFFPCSFGFRPYRATKHAVKQVTHIITTGKKNKCLYAIEGDIKGYFDNINHRRMINVLWKMGIHDKRILSIVKEMLRLGYIEYEMYINTQKGTAQGSILSPILANIYLNSFDWMIGKQYQFPTQRCKFINSDKKRLRSNGVIPKHLIRYADDWVILTTTEGEATRILRKLLKYFKAKLKVELSEEKTVITDMTKKPVKFLGFNIIAEKPRSTPSKPNPENIVGKVYPNPKRVSKQISKITQEIRKLKTIPNNIQRAIQIEKINSIITGIAEYWKISICGKVFNRIDNNVDCCAYTVFRKIYNEDIKWHKYPMKELNNRPQRHKGYDSKVFGVELDGMKIGITKAFITHSRWEKYPFNQKMTPYTAIGRELYEKQNTRKRQPLNRPPLYSQADLQNAKCKDSIYNFEYYMNREYAYNRDRGKCRKCKLHLGQGNRVCNHKDMTLPLNQINKVQNLVWKCKSCS